MKFLEAWADDLRLNLTNISNNSMALVTLMMANNDKRKIQPVFLNTQYKFSKEMSLHYSFS